MRPAYSLRETAVFTRRRRVKVEFIIAYILFSVPVVRRVWVFALRYNDFIGSAAAQAGGLATSVLIIFRLSPRARDPRFTVSPISIKGLTPVEYYLPLGRISFGQPIQAFLLGPPYPTPNTTQWREATSSHCQHCIAGSFPTRAPPRGAHRPRLGYLVGKGRGILPPHISG